MVLSVILLKRGTLWGDLVGKTEQALRAGALAPIPTEYVFMEDGGIRFMVRILSDLEWKDKIGAEQKSESSLSHREVNPFLPYEEDLFVADISDTHVGLLNKFNVVPHHLLIVTRFFEDQETLLTLKDFESLLVCMGEYEGLGFYNGGEAAGASQQHKHLQIVPLPLVPSLSRIPIEPLLSTVRFAHDMGSTPKLPFLHVFALIHKGLLKSSMDAAGRTFELYGRMLERVGMEPPGTEGTQRQSVPYCLLVSREWMLLVPRSREFFHSISINSLGFAGALLCRMGEQLDTLRKYGPLEALRSVALPENPT
jgi:ATP adenylyltransferase